MRDARRPETASGRIFSESRKNFAARLKLAYEARRGAFGIV
jgi:hypothetical protein